MAPNQQGFQNKRSVYNSASGSTIRHLRQHVKERLIYTIFLDSVEIVSSQGNSEQNEEERLGASLLLKSILICILLYITSANAVSIAFRIYYDGFHMLLARFYEAGTR